MKLKKKISTGLIPAFLLSFLAMGVAKAEEEQLANKMDKESLRLEKEKEDNRPPIGCRETGYEFDLEALHLLPGQSGEAQSMYLLHNQLGQPINLFQMRDEESSRALFFNHTIGAHEWGILSTSENRVKFICTLSDKKSPYGRVIDCGQSLKICEYTNVRYGLNNRGNFWLLNSSTRNGAVNAIVHYGIIPGN